MCSTNSPATLSHHVEFSRAPTIEHIDHPNSETYQLHFQLGAPAEMRPLSAASLLTTTVVLMLCVSGRNVVDGQVSVTLADSLRPVYRMMRNFLFDNFGRTDNQWAYSWNLQRGVSGESTNVCSVVRQQTNIGFPIGSATLSAESPKAVSARAAVFLRSARCRHAQSARRASALRASPEAGRHRHRRRDWRLADGRQRSAGHESQPVTDREQGRFMVDWRPGDVAQVPDAAEHSEGVQSGTVRLFAVGWLFDTEDGQVRGLLC